MTTSLRTGICILLSDDRILLQFRDEKAPMYPLSFGNWGGGREEGETALECARRELEEELGIRVDPADILFIYSDNFAGLSRDMFLLRKDIQLSDLRLEEGGGFVCVPRKIAGEIIPMNILLKNDLKKLDGYLSSL